MSISHTTTLNDPRSSPSTSLQYSTCMETPAVSANKPRVFSTYCTYVRPDPQPPRSYLTDKPGRYEGLFCKGKVKTSCTPRRTFWAESRMCVCVRATFTKGTCSQGHRFMRGSLWWLCMKKSACTRVRGRGWVERCGYSIGLGAEAFPKLCRWTKERIVLRFGSSFFAPHVGAVIGGSRWAVLDSLGIESLIFDFLPTFSTFKGNSDGPSRRDREHEKRYEQRF
jgi:hypothetical protein